MSPFERPPSRPKKPWRRRSSPQHAAVVKGRAHAKPAGSQAGAVGAEDLEQRAHLFGRGQPLDGAGDVGGFARDWHWRAPWRARRCRAGAGIRPASPAGATARPVALAASPSTPKSTWAERSASPGASSGSAKAWRLHRLQGLAGLGARVAIVDGEDRAALQRDLAGQLLHGVDGGGRKLEDFARRRRRALRAAPLNRRSGWATGRRRAWPSMSPTRRSCQPSSVRTNWRIGRASKNSLAMTNSGSSATASISVGPIGRVGAEALFLLAL